MAAKGLRAINDGLSNPCEPAHGLLCIVHAIAQRRLPILIKLAAIRGDNVVPVLLLAQQLRDYVAARNSGPQQRRDDVAGLQDLLG